MRIVQILAVDDDEDMLALIEVHLEKLVIENASIKLHLAESIKKAKEVLLCEKIDLLLTDYSMPGGNGAELASFAKKILPNVIVIINTAKPDVANQGEADFVRDKYRWNCLPWQIQTLLGEFTSFTEKVTPCLPSCW